MLEHKQIFVMRHCKMCSECEDRFGRDMTIKRMFVSHTNDPNKFICTTPGCCGFTETLTDEEIEESKVEDAQLNNKEVYKNDISGNKSNNLETRE